MLYEIRIRDIHGPIIERSDQRERRGKQSCLEIRIRAMRFVSRLPVDPHGLRPRDDNTKSTQSPRPVIARSDERERRGNPSCLEGRVRQCGTFLDSQWIATGYALAMAIRRVPRPHALSLREATEGRDAAIHRVSKDVFGNVVRFLTPSGSLRAAPSRWQGRTRERVQGLGVLPIMTFFPY